MQIRSGVSIACVLLFVGLVPVRSDEHKNSNMLTLTRSEPSPSRDFLEEHYMFSNKNSEYDHEVWLVDATNVSKRELLYKHERHVEIKYSDNESWLVINDDWASNESRVLLYQRKGKLRYEKVADISSDAWAFLMKETGHQLDPLLDHNYVEVLTIYGGDNPTLVLSLTGHGSQHHYVSGAMCLYSVKEKRFSTNLADFNRKQVVLE